MTKKIIIGTVITAIAVTLLLTFSNVAYSSPIGDTITVAISIDGLSFITDVVVVEGAPELNAQPIDFPGIGTIFVTLDVEDGEIWVTYDGDPGIVLPAHVVHIEDLDWFDENGLPLEGQITTVTCFGNLDAVVDSGVDSILFFVEEQVLNELLEIHCEFNTEHVPPPEPACITEHWDKIIFEIVRDPSGTINPNYLKTPLDIKVLDDPTSVANLVAKVRGFIEDHGIANVPPFDPADPDNITDEIVAKLKIDIIDVEYAIVCIEFVDVMLPNGS